MGSRRVRHPANRSWRRRAAVALSGLRTLGDLASTLDVVRKAA